MDTEMVHKVCPKCYIEFAIPAAMNRMCEETGKKWHCPNGHAIAYTISKIDKVTQALEDMTRYKDNLFNMACEQSCKIRKLQRQIAGYRGQCGRLMARVRKAEEAQPRRRTTTRRMAD